MPSPLSGNGGTLSIAGQSGYDIRSWSLGRTADNQPYVSSQTETASGSKGATYRVKGNFDASMNISLYAPDGAIDLAIGIEEGETVGIVGTTNGVITWEGNMIVDSMEIVVNIETGENIGIDLVLSAVDSTSYPA